MPSPIYLATSVLWKDLESQSDPKANPGKTFPRDACLSALIISNSLHGDSQYPKTGLNMSPFLMLCGRPFLSSDMGVDPETTRFPSGSDINLRLSNYGNKFLQLLAQGDHLVPALETECSIKLEKRGS